MTSCRHLLLVLFLCRIGRLRLSNCQPGFLLYLMLQSVDSCAHCDPVQAPIFNPAADAAFLQSVRGLPPFPESGSGHTSCSVFLPLLLSSLCPDLQTAGWGQEFPVTGWSGSPKEAAWRRQLPSPVVARGSSFLQLVHMVDHQFRRPGNTSGRIRLLLHREVKDQRRWRKCRKQSAVIIPPSQQVSLSLLLHSYALLVARLTQPIAYWLAQPIMAEQDSELLHKTWQLLTKQTESTQFQWSVAIG